MRVLHAAAELFPWVKTGGLGDVIAALPAALVALEVDVRLVLPGFTGFLDAFKLSEVARLRTPFAAERVRLALAALPKSGVRAYLVDHPAFYDRPGSPYADPDGHDWPDNHRRFALLGWVAAALAQGADPAWRPDILHAHDWHAGLAPAYLRAAGAALPNVFTIHNLAYQGAFPAELFSDLALPPSFFAIDGIEFYGGFSFLKAGIFYADRLTTVSPTYAEEIQTPAFGNGLDGLLRSRASVLTGILNGVDPEVWSPEHDALLPRPYGPDDAVAGKAAAKAALQQRFGFNAETEAPLFGAVTRLTPQKGLDLLLAALPGLVESGGRLALLGSHRHRIHLRRGKLRGVARSRPARHRALRRPGELATRDAPGHGTRFQLDCRGTALPPALSNAASANYPQGRARDRAISPAKRHKRKRRQLRADGAFHQAAVEGLVAPPPIWTIMMAVPPVMVRVIAFPPEAVPEAPRLGGLRSRDTDEECDRRKGAQNELHRVVPP